MIKNHPSVEYLSDFAAGNAPISLSLGISGHLEYCGDCAAQVKKLQRLGASLMASIEPQPLATQDASRLLGDVMARIQSQDSAHETDDAQLDVKASPKSTQHSGYVVPRVLKQFIPQDYNDLKWRSLSPSFQIATLLKDTDGSQIALSRVKPGGTMPHHTHAGDEMTLVLEGSFSDEFGVYKQGDFILKSSKDKHTPIVTMDGECICLMVLDGPVQFTGFIARLLNPLLRIQHWGLSSN